MAFGVPVKVMVASSPEQIVASPEMVTVGIGSTVMVTVPVTSWLQLGVPVKVM